MENTALLDPTRRVTRRARITLRRRKLPSIRLGGGKRPRPGTRRREFVTVIKRSVRLKWLRLRCFFMLKKLRDYYRNILRDLSEASATVEAFQRRVLIEASFAVPVVMGVSFARS